MSQSPDQNSTTKLDMTPILLAEFANQLDLVIDDPEERFIISGVSWEQQFVGWVSGSVTHLSRSFTVRYGFA